MAFSLILDWSPLKARRSLVSGDSYGSYSHWLQSGHSQKRKMIRAVSHFSSNLFLRHLK